MGVDVHAISIYGIKIDWDRTLNDVLNEIDYCDHNDPHILKDVMGGKYMILGPVLFDSGSDRRGFIGDAFVALEPWVAEQRWQEWKTKFREKFSDFTHYLDSPPKFITLMHYT